MIFSITFLFFLIIMSLEDILKQKIFNFLWPLAFLILAYGIASKVYEDEYRKFYFLIEDASWSLQNFWMIFYEKGWFFATYTKLINFLNLGPIIYIIIPSFISLMIQKNFFYKHSFLPALSLFLFFSHGFIVRESITIRSGIVASLMLVLITCLCERKNLKFYFYLIIAIGIHYIAILGALLIFLRKLFSPYLYIIVITITFVISILGFPKLLLVFLGQKFPIVDLYLNSHYADPVTFTNPKLIQQFLISLSLIYIVLKHKFEIITDNFLILIINTYFFSTFLFIFFRDFGIFAFRSATMFSVVEPIIIVFIICRLFKKKGAWLVCILMASVIFTVNYFIFNRNTVFNNNVNIEKSYSDRLKE